MKYLARDPNRGVVIDLAQGDGSSQLRFERSDGEEFTWSLDPQSARRLRSMSADGVLTMVESQTSYRPRGETVITDHERVEAALRERSLGPEHYEAVAVELASAGRIRHGEDSSAAGTPSMEDHEAVEAELARRNLSPEHYEDVAFELAEAGEIRQSRSAAIGTAEAGKEDRADHRIVEATLAARNLGPEAYEDVAIELAETGEIRR